MTEFDLSKQEIKERLNDMVWSFSRLNSVGKCAYAWYLHYIAGYPEQENGFAQFGTILHTTLEKYLKGELDLFSVSEYYQEHYPEIVTCDFPANKYADLGQKAYEAGLEYFNNINFDFDRYEILGVEKELKFKIGKYMFQGFADAVYKDRETGEIILRDHKTSSFKYLKNGGISKTNAEHFEEFKKQEYLYCIPLIEEYGKVDKLSWNMIRDQRIIEIPFNEKEFEEAQKWAIEQIKTIEREVLWLPDTSSSYFCQVLCGQRANCPYKQ
jgi:hypothetical protein